MSEDNNTYVYIHRLVETNKVFYVGLGKSNRMYSRHGRSKPWWNIVKENDWYYSVVKEGMSRKEASELEVALISFYKPAGNIHIKTLETRSLNEDMKFIKERYVYDETSPTCLRYRQGNNQHGKKKRVAGDIAGTLSVKSNRYTVSANGKNILIHRAIWFLINNEDPLKYVIDHIDGNSLNNNITNLRKVSISDNNKNVGFNKRSKTGYKGITLLRNKYYCVDYKNNGLSIKKHFSIDKFGKELALALAIEYRFRKIKELINAGERYTERHVGKYFKSQILNSFSESEITDMFNDNLWTTNTSGRTYVYFSSYKGNDFWVVALGSKVNFSVTKFGNDLAKALAFEYLNRSQGIVSKNVDGYSLEETNKMLEDKTRASNVSGFHGISYSMQGKTTLVKAQKLHQGKNYSKCFSCKKMGITVALYTAVVWLKELNIKIEQG